MSLNTVSNVCLPLYQLVTYGSNIWSEHACECVCVCVRLMLQKITFEFVRGFVTLPLSKLSWPSSFCAETEVRASNKPTGESLFS